MRQIYLDYNATTPIAPSVFEAMKPFLHDHYGNPSSSHAFGRAAKEAIEDARVKVANLLGCDRTEIVYTGGGTESNNAAIKGIMLRGTPSMGGHLIISAIEHAAVSAPAKFLEKLGFDVTVVECDSDGVVQPETVERALRSDTRLVSVMHANNETGVIQPISAISEVCHQRGVLVHTDASQSVGKIPTMVEQMGVDLLTIAGHKLYGPKGIGVLYVREGLVLEPLLHGAGHEGGLRSGTENTPYIVGLGQAAFLAMKGVDESGKKLSELRDRFFELLSEAIPGATINGGNVERLPNTLSVSFPNVTGHEILRRVPELCASTGPACHSDDASYGSATLTAMGKSREQIMGTVRLTLGWYTSEEEIERAANLLVDAWENLTSVAS